MATNVRYTMLSSKLEDTLINVEDALLDDWLKPVDRDISKTLEAVLDTAIEDGGTFVASRTVFDWMLDLGYVVHTDFVGGVECNDCRGTFFLRKNGTHCSLCKGLL